MPPSAYATPTLQRDPGSVVARGIISYSCDLGAGERATESQVREVRWSRSLDGSEQCFYLGFWKIKKMRMQKREKLLKRKEIFEIKKSKFRTAFVLQTDIKASPGLIFTPPSWRGNDF